MRLYTLAFVLLICPVMTAAQDLTTTKIDETLGRTGQKSGDIYRVSFPRTDLHVIADGVAIKPGLALGSWAAFAGTDEHASVMGDLVLLPDEIDGVMRKLRSAGFEISAVHNHLDQETPQVMYMHYMGRGEATDLAKSLRSALAGAQGVAESINFQEASPGKVATTGDFVLIAHEVNPVISALLEHNIRVTALHTHMLTEHPRIFFMHFWAVGPPESVGLGIKAALDKIQIK